MTLFAISVLHYAFFPIKVDQSLKVTKYERKAWNRTGIDKSYDLLQTESLSESSRFFRINFAFGSCAVIFTFDQHKTPKLEFILALLNCKVDSLS